MRQTLHYHLKRHRYKVLVGAPVILLVASSLSFSRTAENMCLVTDDTQFVRIGESVTMHVVASADEPINVLGGTVSLPAHLVHVDTITREQSIVSLWIEEPTLTESGTLIRFSGGIINQGGFTGKGDIFSFTLHPTATGTAEFAFTETHMLAHDGTGKEVTCPGMSLHLVIRDADAPSPDVNSDRTLNLYDVGLMTIHLFSSYNPLYDLNHDGVVTMRDLGLLLSTISKEKRR